MKSEFSVAYEVSGGLVRAISAGSSKNQNGEFEWGASVVISSCSFHTQEVNEKTGFANTIKQEIDFKISCPTDLQAGEVAKNIQNAFLSNKVLYFRGNIPLNYNGNIVVKVTNPITEFLDKSKK